MQHYGRRHFSPVPHNHGEITRSALRIMACLFLIQGFGISSVIASPMGYAILNG